MTDGVHFDFVRILKPLVQAQKKEVVSFAEFTAHTLQILQGEREQLTLCLTHNSKLPLEFVRLLLPFIHGDLMLQNTSKNVDETKMTSNVVVHVLDIVITWKHKSANAIFQEVHIAYLIALEVNILVLGVQLRLQEWAYPSNEGTGSVPKENDLAVCTLMNEE